MVGTLEVGVTGAWAWHAVVSKPNRPKHKPAFLPPASPCEEGGAPVSLVSEVDAKVGYLGTAPQNEQCTVGRMAGIEVVFDREYARFSFMGLLRAHCCAARPHRAVVTSV